MIDMLKREEILKILKNNKTHLKMNYGIIKIGIFGSHARDCATEKSDIDIYAEFEANNFRNIAGAWNYLEKQLGTGVDFVHFHKNMRESLKKNIQNEIIYG
jgi:predicted nucleotidyltransferase